MHNFVKITKALSDENRIRILLALQRGELCLCQIIEMLGLASSTVSKHASILSQAGLVSVRKEGRWRYFSLPGKGAPPSVREGLKWVLGSLAKDRIALRDAKKVKSILRTSTEEFCKNYRCRSRY